MAQDRLKLGCNRFIRLFAKTLPEVTEEQLQLVYARLVLVGKLF